MLLEKSKHGTPKLGIELGLLQENSGYGLNLIKNGMKEFTFNDMILKSFSSFTVNHRLLFLAWNELILWNQWFKNILFDGKTHFWENKNIEYYTSEKNRLYLNLNNNAIRVKFRFYNVTPQFVIDLQ